MRALLQEREPFYRMAHHQVEAEKAGAEAVAAEVLELARRHGGW
jgi:hypothetical protein